MTGDPYEYYTLVCGMQQVMFLQYLIDKRALPVHALNSLQNGFRVGKMIMINENRLSDRKDFFNVLPTFIPGNIPCFLAGDFNCVPDPCSDRMRVSRNGNSSVGILELGYTLDLNDLSDTWRDLNPSACVFTWHKPDGSDASRLDRIYGPADYVIMTQLSLI